MPLKNIKYYHQASNMYQNKSQLMVNMTCQTLSHDRQKLPAFEE